MNLPLYDEDVEAYIKENYSDLDREAQGRERFRLHNLIRAAKPGNPAWHKLEDEMGFAGDYTPADEGMHWSD